MKDRVELTEELLRKYYISNNLTASEISEITKYSPAQINRYLKKYNISKSIELRNECAKRKNLEKYGEEYPMKLKRIQEKAKKTNLEKYGVEHPLQSEFIKNKADETNIKKYGHRRATSLPSTKNKVKQTNIERFGCAAPLQNDILKEKSKQTCLEKYGVEYFINSSDFKDKTKNTLNTKYNVDNVFQLDNIKEKSRQTCLEKYGTEYAAQSEIIKEKIKNTNITKYGYDNPVKSIEIMNKIRNTNLEKYGVEYYCLTQDCVSSNNGNNSKPNILFEKLLDKNNIKYEREFNIDNYRYDFKVGDILIEIDPSITHNSSFGIRGRDPLNITYHKNKSKTANDNNYSCIHIFDWDDQNKIINILKQKKTIYARNCKIKEIDNDECSNFLNKYHIQSSINKKSINIGLFYNDILISVMTFGKPRYNKNYEYELLRLCFHPDYKITGGSEKMFSYFINKYNPSSIISYCDNSKFNGSVYTKLGFDLLIANKPSKHWYNLKTKKHITNNLLLQRGYDQLFCTSFGNGSSNDDLMKQSGFVEIYDCGQSTYVWKKEEN